MRLRTLKSWNEGSVCSKRRMRHNSKSHPILELTCYLTVHGVPNRETHHFDGHQGNFDLASPACNTVWSSIERKALKKILPIGYTTVCRSHVEREHQFTSRTAINCSCRHDREAQWGGKPWSARMVSISSERYSDRSLMDDVKSSQIPACQPC